MKNFRLSENSSFIRSLAEGIKQIPVGQLPPLPQADLDITLLIPAKGANEALIKTVELAHEYLSRHFENRFEIILIPNPGLQNSTVPTDRSVEIADQLSKQYSSVRSIPHRERPGKGYALRSGFLASRGRTLFFTDADLPYDLSFINEAYGHLNDHCDFITGNRRLLNSVFDLPVELLRVTYSRHRLGLAFNRVVRVLLPIQTTDTQAGIKGMRRELALAAFSQLTCPGFFFDLELFLTSQGQSFKHIELPVTLRMNTEKSTVRIFRESILAGYWLAKITLRHYFRNAYGKN